MVICTYFLNNTCRFGTKCHNEHVNVKLTLKTDAEGALKGNQWPLSSYGPFRDKPCIPNFIEDQSFEEARHLCYEAKASGNVQMLTSQFTQNVMNAKNKMNMLINPTDEVAMLVTNIYNSSCTAAPTQAPNANPFGMGANTMNSGGSIFTGGNATTNSNLFGSSSATATVNPFARNAAGFGAPAQAQTSSLFGNASTPAVPATGNLFGGSANTTGASLFGGSSFAQNTGSSSAFPSTTMSAYGGNSAFGGNAAAGSFSQQNTGASPFALPPTTNQASGLFGGQAQTNPVFGGGASFGSQVKTGLFGQANATLGQPPNTGSIFGQSVQNSGFGAPAPTNNPFGNVNASQTQSSQSIFGGQQTMQAQDNPFAAVAQSATTNIFGNAQTQQQQAPQQPPQQQTQPSPFQSSTNMFGGNASAFCGNQSLFGGNQGQTMNQMGAVPIPAQANTLQQQQQSIFGTNSFVAQPPAMPTQTPFGGNVFQSQQPQDVQKPPTQSLFGNQMAPQQSPFGAPPAQQAPQPPKTLYTPMDSLDPEDLEAFRSNTFDISRIPTKPPPMELCT